MRDGILVKCGVHISIAGAVDRAVDRAKEKTCDTFQVFTRNPRSWKSKKLKPHEVNLFKEKLKDSGIRPVVAHMPYLANLSCPKQTTYRKSVKTLIEELDRCNALGIPYIVTHLGSHLGKGRKVGLERLIEAIGSALDASEGKATLLLENTAGTRNSMGSSFEDMQEIMEHTTQSRVAICFDTSHAFAAGYNLKDTESVNETIQKLDNTVGIDSLRIIHANDSKGKLGSRIDRHEHIGMGYIGDAGFKAILHTDVFRNLPLILETPIDTRGTDVMNLRRIRRLAT